MNPNDSNQNAGEANDPELVEGPWYVYICISKAGYYYVGISPNPRKRLEKHNSGHGAKMAIDQGGFDIVYISDSFVNKSLARKREIQIKKWSRDKKKKLIDHHWK